MSMQPADIARDAVDATPPEIERATPAAARRHDVVDHARGLGILLVVIGHVWDGLRDRVALPAGSFDPVFNWIYSFHMTFFFFLAGLFLHRAAEKPAKRFSVDRLSRLLWPYVIWTIVQGVLQHVPAGKIGLDLVVAPEGQFWFLYVLLLLSFATLALVKLRVPPIGILVAAVGFWLLARIVDLHSVPLYQAASYAPALATAMVVSPWLLRRWGDWPPIIAVGLSVVGCVGVTAIVAHDPHADHRVSLLTGMFGTIMMLGLASLIARLDDPITRRMGLGSMEIFLVHIIVVGLVRTAMLKLHLGQWSLMLGACVVAGIAMPLAMKATVDRFAIPLVFAGPSLRPAKR